MQVGVAIKEWSNNNSKQYAINTSYQTEEVINVNRIWTLPVHNAKFYDPLYTMYNTWDNSNTRYTGTEDDYYA